MDTKNGTAGVLTKRILFVTNSESGQANTILAMGLEASTRPDVEVHIASFPGLKRRVEKLSPKVHFHSLDGKDFMEMAAGNGLHERDFPHRPRSGVFAVYKRALGVILAGYDEESYRQICDSIKGVIEELDPGVIVVDMLMTPGFDACYALNREFVMSTPNTLGDVAKQDQPWLKGYWHYPLMGTGISYPISWRDKPLNIIAGILLIWGVIRSPEVKRLVKYRKKQGLPGRLPMESAQTNAIHIICPSVRETDFPLVVPERVGLYGSIVLDTTPIEVCDPELDQWLNRGKTVLMCMGTHFHYSESQAKAVVLGFLSAVTHDSDIQFLWKLPNRSEFEDLFEEALKDPKDKDRFRIVDWLEVDPASIMKHPNVVAWIHHGGANSYFEGTLGGLPQIILAQWYDLYDMAVRAEYLGIGMYGNKKVAPEIEAGEFGEAVARLVWPGKGSEEFRARAKVVAGACRKAGGKSAAVDKLIEIVEGK